MLSMSFVIYYASKTHRKITRVLMIGEADARKWFHQIRTWKDVIRVRIVSPDGEVVDDVIVESRMIDENPQLEQAHRELAARMDGVFAADREHSSPARRETVKPPTLTVNPSSSDVCWCGHTKIEHAGSDSGGRCQSECRCARFRRRQP